MKSSRRENGSIPRNPVRPHHEISPPSFQIHYYKGPRLRPLVVPEEGTHPEFYEDAKVFCNDELAMTTGRTQNGYNVDVWSGNYPFYLGNRPVLFDADQVKKFRKKYGDLSTIMEMPVLKHRKIVLPKRKKAAGKGKGKK